MLLAGDIGGTKTTLAVFSQQAGPRAPLAEATFPSAGYPGLEAIVREFLARVDVVVERAVFDVAGPVVAGQARVTNLPWVLDEARLQAALGLSSVRLLNDLAAIASAVPHLEPGDLYPLNREGEPVPGGAIAVVAPGTGLGEAYLTWDGERYQAHASEGGHASFAPTDALQIDLLRYLQDRFGRVSCERVCSGIGIPNIYAFLKESGRFPEPAWLAERLAAAEDQTPVIDRASQGEDGCDICRATMDVFVSILGAEAGDLALKVLATGGVYLGGGMPPLILPLLERGFMAAFRRKGRLSDLLARMPVYVILNPRAPLLGVACHGLSF